MRAVTYYTYGGPEVLQLAEIPKPNPSDKQVRIKVQATGVNPMDYRFMSSDPKFVRLMTGLRRPSQPVLGYDVAGIIDAVGSEVGEFDIGEEVYGSTLGGGFSEYALAKPSKIVAKPSAVSFEDAAAIPVAGLTALQGLRDQGQLKHEQRVLIYGASGGVGTYAVQLAKWLGGDVTAVCGPSNLDMVRDLGADEVIDYTKRNYADSSMKFDLVFDAVGLDSFSNAKRVLAPAGRYVSVGGPPLRLPWSLLTSRFHRQPNVMFVATTNQADLQLLVELVEKGELRSVIAGTFSLEEVPEAMQLSMDGHTAGKMIVVP